MTRQLNDLAMIYSRMGVMMACAVWQWPLLFVPVERRRPNLRLIIGGRI